MNDEVAVEQKPSKPLTPRQCRAFLRKELARWYPEIVAGFISGAKSGSVAHFKLATELLEKPAVERKKKDLVFQELWDFGTPDDERQEESSGGM